MSLQATAGVEKKGVWVLTPHYHVRMPIGPTEEMTLRILCFCITGIGALLVLVLMLVPHNGDPEHPATYPALIGTVSVVQGLLGLVVALGVMNDGTTYVPVEGIAEDAGNGRFRVRFANDEEPTTPDMDTLQDKPPVFGRPYTVYRVDLPKISAHNPDGGDAFLIILAVFTFISFLLCAVLVGYKRFSDSTSQSTRVAPTPTAWPVAAGAPTGPVTGIPVRRQDSFADLDLVSQTPFSVSSSSSGDESHRTEVSTRTIPPLDLRRMSPSPNL
jgi:hypothetical protein